MRARNAERAAVYRRRRAMAASVLVLGIVALVLAIFAQTASGTPGRAVPIDPGNAAPDAVLAEVGEVQVSTPIRPGKLTGLGYHPEGGSLAEMDPRGKNLSANPLLRLITGESTPEKIRFYVMPREDREGPRTGALDVGAPAKTAVYAPVSGTVTAIRPDPMVEGANIVEIQPKENPDLRVSVSLVNSERDSAGVKSPVTAGMTELGAVADSAEILDPQLSGYTSDAGNHVTISVSSGG